MIKTIIEDGSGDDFAVKVTNLGQLVTSPIKYSEVSSLSMDTPNIAFNLVTPIAGCNIIITDIILGADKNVSATNGAIIEIYEADAPDSIVVSKQLFTIDLLKNQTFPAIGLNFQAGRGVWVNAKTDDVIVKVTLGYYHVG